MKKNYGLAFFGLIGLAGAAAAQGSPPADGRPPKPPTGEQWVARLDTDQDQRVSAAEFDGPPEHFTRLDRNEDGFLEAAEAPKARPQGPPSPEGGTAAETSRGAGKKTRPPGGGGPQGFINRLDQDHDGKVSAAEFDGPPEHFSHFDRDQDGFIALEEAPKGPPPGRRPPPRQGN